MGQRSHDGKVIWHRRDHVLRQVECVAVLSRSQLAWHKLEATTWTQNILQKQQGSNVHVATY